MMDSRRSLLSSGLDQLNLPASDSQLEQMLGFLDLLNDWNRKINLTAIEDRNEQVIKHLLDSLSVYPHIQADKILDVGTGAGLPGLPLAIMQPEKQWHLLDSSVKRISFIRVAMTRLAVSNVTLFAERVEKWQPPEKYPVIISRAFASLEQMVNNVEHLLDTDGQLLAMKGRYPEDEIAALPKHWALVDSRPLQVPHLNEERHLLILKRRD